MADISDKIFIFDLHNTLYDEVIEYGGAMADAVSVFFDAAADHGVTLDEDAFFSQLAQAHKAAGSDWYEAVWDDVAAIRAIPGYSDVIRRAMDVRRAASEAYTKQYAYHDTIDAIKALKQKGATLILATEATANAAADGIRFLGLDGVFDRVYSWPYGHEFDALKQSKQCDFPEHTTIKGRYVEKPSAAIIGQVLLDLAKADGGVDVAASFADVWDLVDNEAVDKGLILQEIEDPDQYPHAVEVAHSIARKLQVKDGAHAQALQALRARTYFVGDSYFKDGLLAANAGVPFVHALYGKAVSDQAHYERCRDMLYKVSGWDPMIIKLTHQAEAIPAVTDLVKPAFVCHNSFGEFISQFQEAS